MAEPGRQAGEGADAQRFLTFRMEERLYALPAAEVSEVIRTPAVARVPQGPRALLGIANLRGSAMPVASLRVLLGRDEASAGAGSRAIVLDGAAPVALAVDRVEALVTVGGDEVESDRAVLAAHPGERLRGVFHGAGHDTIKVLDIGALLAEVITQRARLRRDPIGGAVSAQTTESAIERERLVSFEVAGQEYALALDVVREIIPAPRQLLVAANDASLALGVAAYRDGLLPILSLRGLLGFAAREEMDGREKVLVIHVGGALVGLLADRTRAVIAIDPDLVEPPPAVLTARLGGEARTKAIYRGEGGRRLISILAPELLFREDVMRKLTQARDSASAKPAATPRIAAADQAVFLVFRLGEEEFGLPLEAVDEVARVPDRITRVPRTPKFLEGVVNLRGEVLPVVDQRRRFGMSAAPDAGRRRLVVVRSDRHRAGLIVDSVSEVLRVEREAVENAPDLTGEEAPLVDGVINLEDTRRMVLLLAPAELLSRAERGLLDAFEAASKADDL